MMRYKCPLLWVTILFLFAFAKSQRRVINFCGNREKIPCDNSQCIYRDEWCDRKNDCEDRSDEKYCRKHGWLNKIDNHCVEGKHFTCGDGPCIPATASCDGIDDCWDSSDEEDYCNQTSTEGLTSAPPVTITERSNPLAHRIHNRPTTGYVISTSPPTPYFTSYNTPDYYGRRQSESVDRSGRNFDINNRNNYSPTTPNYPRQNNVPNYTPNYNPQYSYYDSRQNPEHYNRQSNWNNQIRQNARDNQNRQSTWENQNRQRYADYDIYEDNYNENRTSPTRQTYPSTAYNPTTRRNTRIPFREHETRRDPVVPRQHPQMIQPRVVLHPPPSRHSYSSGKMVKSLSLPRFYFKRDYAHEFGSRYEHVVEKARQWLLEQRDNTSYTWKSDTPRVLVALSLIENNFSTDVVGNELMMKGLQTHLGIALLRNKADKMPISRLAMYINALLATCQNPRDFMELDLVSILSQRAFSDQTVEQNPFVYLTLCLSGVEPNRIFIEILTQFLQIEFVNQRMKEQHILATSALACFLQQNPKNREISRIVDSAIDVLHRQKYSDGSYGDIYSTALAAQAFMSVNTTLSWDPRRMLEFISDHQQQQDGSFGDLLSTYYSIPALSGRSLVHIRNTWCKKTVASQTLSPTDILNTDGPTKSFFISVAVGHPQRSYYAMQLTVRKDANLLDSLKAAEYLDRRFQFESEEFFDMTEVHSILKLSNDPELGWHWYLFELDPLTNSLDLSQKQRIDIKRKIPEDNNEYLFWYLPSV